MKFLVFLAIMVVITLNTPKIEALQELLKRDPRGFSDFFWNYLPGYAKTRNNTKTEQEPEKKSSGGVYGFFKKHFGGQSTGIDSSEGKSAEDFVPQLVTGSNKPKKVAMAEGSGKISGTGIVVGEVKVGSPEGVSGHAKSFEGDGKFEGYGKGLAIVY